MKQRKSQSHMARWQARALDAELKRKYRDFNRGSHRFKQQIKVTHDDIMRHGLGRTQDDTLTSDPLEDTETTPEAEAQELCEFHATLELLSDGGIGYLPSTKRSGRVRLYFENWNSLGIFMQKWKLDKLNALIKQLPIDIVVGCESQVDWRFAPPHMQFTNLLTPGQGVKGIAAHNTTG